MEESKYNYYPDNPAEAEAFETSPKHPDMRMLYAVLLIFAVVGFIGIQTIQRLLGGARVDAQESADPARLESMVANVPWLLAAGLVLLAVGTTILIIYIFLRFSRIRPVSQEPLNNITWGLGALVKGLIIVFFLLVAFSFVGSILLSPFHLPEIATVLIIDSTTKILACIWIITMLRFEYGARIPDMGLKSAHPLRDTFYAFLTYLAILPVFTLAAFAWQWLGEYIGLEYKPSPVIDWLLDSESSLTLVMISLSAIVVAPLVEEFFFRCFTYPALRKYLGVVPAVVLSATYFSLIHFDFFSFLPIMLLGVGLAFLYERRQNIVGPAALHFFNNARVVVLVLYLRFYAN